MPGCWRSLLREAGELLALRALLEALDLRAQLRDQVRVGLRPAEGVLADMESSPVCRISFGGLAVLSEVIESAWCD